MKLSGRISEKSICVQTITCQFHFMENDKGEVAIHNYPPQDPRFECVAGACDGPIWSGQIWTNESTRSEFLLVLFYDNQWEGEGEARKLVGRFLIVAMPGHNPYGISGPGICTDKDGKIQFTQEEVLAEMKERGCVPHENMRCDVVPGVCGTYRLHRNDS